MKKCNYCAEEIKDEAIKCKHCAADLIISGDNQVRRNTNIVVFRLLKLLAYFILINIGISIFLFTMSEILFQLEARKTEKRAEEAVKLIEEDNRARKEAEEYKQLELDIIKEQEKLQNDNFHIPGNESLSEYLRQFHKDKRRNREYYNKRNSNRDGNNCLNKYCKTELIDY